MSVNDSVKELIARIDKTGGLLKRLTDQYDDFLNGDFKHMGKKNTSAMVLAEFMVDYYTCLETCFFRISQFFENHLSKDRWHSDLLEKMTLHIEGERDAVITDAHRGGIGGNNEVPSFPSLLFRVGVRLGEVGLPSGCVRQDSQVRPHGTEQVQTLSAQTVDLSDRQLDVQHVRPCTAGRRTG